MRRQRPSTARAAFPSLSPLARPPLGGKSWTDVRLLSFIPCPKFEDSNISIFKYLRLSIRKCPSPRIMRDKALASLRNLSFLDHHGLALMQYLAIPSYG